MTLMQEQSADRDTRAEGVGVDEQVQLTVTGELDIATVERFMFAGREALSGRHHTTLAINLAQVTFIDAAGVGALVTIRNHARRNDNQVTVTEPARCVLRILDLTALTTTFMERQSATPERPHRTTPCA
jgi:anti-sigma B factor antagonist